MIRNAYHGVWQGLFRLNPLLSIGPIGSIGSTGAKLQFRLAIHDGAQWRGGPALLSTIPGQAEAKAKRN